MRKVVPVLLILVMISSMIVPVFAADDVSDSNSSSWVDLMEYCYINGTSNSRKFQNGYLHYVTTSTYDIRNIYYLDILVQASEKPTEVKFVSGSKEVVAEVYDLGKDIYRILANPVFENVNGFSMYVSSASGSVNVSFLQFNINVLKSYVFNLEPKGEYAAGEETGYLSDAGLFSVPSRSSGVGVDSEWMVDLYCDNWYLYDYITYTLVIDRASLSRISADNGYVDIPVEYSFFEFDPAVDDWTTSTLEYNVYYDFALVNLKIDLTGLTRTAASAVPIIRIGGIYYGGTGMAFQARYCHGGILVNSDNVWQYRWAQLQNKLSDIASSIGDLLTGDDADTSGADDLIDQAGEVDDLVGELDQVTKPAIEDIDVSLDDVVSQSDIINSSVPLQTLLRNDLFLYMCLISLTLAFAGYVLFGKR